ncbi:hypothetical protein [Nitrospira moscoviensis]|uniref:Uncharacterized protein n=1 Tax=Nitrospira moscoviensis TaxID=42253 RepID=A0A0K2GCJ7_NITMO|nr:hypothetical protein [Nitrospira moscoviensis]ALA58322.1 hypothetical protein NITMOv2_1902 [Nitrospira moscoviensis]
MSIQRAVKDFIAGSRSLYRQLREDGEGLSDVDLVALREQLHLLDAEAGDLQDRKEFGSADALFLFDGRRPSAAKPVGRRHHG